MRAALAFLTPFGGARTPDGRTFGWFPFVGAAIGVAVGLVWWGAGEIWPPLMAAAIAVTVDLILTGILHIDGLVDSADGLLPHLSRERRLEVMTEPTVGAFGIAVVAMVLVLRLAAFASIQVDSSVVALCAGLWCASRTLMAVVPGVVPYARSEGLASAFGVGTWQVTGVVGLVLSLGLGAEFGVGGAVAVVVGLLAGAGVVAFGRYRLGGYTGDVLGAAGVVTETVGLIVASAKW